MAYLVPEADEAFEVSRQALLDGKIPAATANEAVTSAAKAITMALKGLSFEVAALREALGDAADRAAGE